jgi:hypothetical protein
MLPWVKRTNAALFGSCHLLRSRKVGLACAIGASEGGGTRSLMSVRRHQSGIYEWSDLSTLRRRM